ncbi:hypothetical protein ACJJTC_010145 [Scirpophaga incertulas]
MESERLTLEVLLFPEEGWARSASSSYWTLQPCWWRRTRCKVVEVAGTRRHSTHARMVVSGGNAVHIVGTFKHLGTDADFKLYLTTNPLYQHIPDDTFRCSTTMRHDGHHLKTS